MKQKITPEATPEQKNFEGGWTYEPEKLGQLTEAVNKITDYEETVSMEQVEAVLMAINYPQFSEQWAGQATPVKRDGNFTLEDMLKAIQYGKTIDPHDNLLYGKEYTEFMQSLTPAIDKSNEAELK